MRQQRNKIDKLDKKIMLLLEKRYKVVKNIAQYKKQNTLPVENLDRENQILAKASKFNYEKEIKNVYQEIFKQSKNLQSISFALIGKKLPYTLSPLIYKALGLDEYLVIETDDFNKTINTLTYQALNITIPYKEEAYKYCKEHDISSIKTKAANLIINNKAYNTDYLALIDMVNASNLDFSKMKVLIIGNGASSRSANQALDSKNIIHLVRTIRSDQEVSLADYSAHFDAEVIINTSPYGTYPNIEKDPLFSLEEFKNLKLVVDVVYNPLNTALLKAAKKQGIPTLNGFELLVRQACIAYQLFGFKTIEAKSIYQKLLLDNINIVLIGMPYAGKSTLASKLAQALDKEVFDFDDKLQKQGLDLVSVLEFSNIERFREEELLMAKSLINARSKIISPGGGIILSEEAMYYLSLNSIIVFVDTKMPTLLSRFDNSRPLIKTKKDLEDLYKARIDLYNKYADITISEDENIMEKIYAYLYN